MREEFLHFVWQHRLFDHRHLTDDSGQPLEIYHPGTLNRDSGPDFSEAKLTLSDMEWAGQVEMHLRASDWQRHGHSDDRAYDNVILHVVWENDRQVQDSHGKPVPTLTLKGRVSDTVISNYERLMASLASIPCAGQFHQVNTLAKISMLGSTLLERLARKGVLVLDVLQHTDQSWEETTYVLLARGLGLKVNAEAFQRLALCTPLRLLRKHGDSLPMVEALLFGQSGLLPQDSDDAYVLQLRRDYAFLQKKYRLSPMDPVQWKFHRLRPANFPTVRIAQLAAMVYSAEHLFNLVTEDLEEEELMPLLRVPQSIFWHSHYHFHEKAEKVPLGIGEGTAALLIINTVAPLLHIYSLTRDTEEYTERALRLLENLPPEQNRIIRQWKGIGLTCDSAAETQAALELFQEYCQKKQCLDCKIGYKLVRE